MSRLVLLLVVAGALSAPTRADAHPNLRRSTPADGSLLPSAPAAIVLWFSERPELSMTIARLSDSAGRSYALSSASRSGADALAVEFRVRDTLPPGRYTLAWRAASSDGHPVQGQVAFIVLGAPTATAPPPVREPPVRADVLRDDADTSASAANSIARAVLFAGLLTLIGTVTFALLVLPHASELTPSAMEHMMQRAAILGLTAAAVIVGIAMVRLYLVSETMRAMPVMAGLDSPTPRDMVMRTGWGLAFRLQLIAAFVAFGAFFLAARRVQMAWYAAALAGVVLAVTPALSGHAASSPTLTPLMVASDWLHVLGGASWLGTLLSVMVIGVPIALTLEGPERWKSVSSLVNAFSPLAIASVTVVVASGIVASWVHLTHVSDFWSTAYGLVLTAKLGLVTIAIGLGAYNFSRVQPQLSAESGALRLRKSAAVELGTGFLILIVTGLLTGLSP